jgi:hypothetical protein
MGHLPFGFRTLGDYQRPFESKKLAPKLEFGLKVGPPGSN